MKSMFYTISKKRNFNPKLPFEKEVAKVIGKRGPKDISLLRFAPVLRRMIESASSEDIDAIKKAILDPKNYTKAVKIPYECIMVSAIKELSKHFILSSYGKKYMVFKIREEAKK